MPIRPLYDVTDGIRLHHSTERPRVGIRSAATPIVRLSPFPRYGGLKFDRKWFGPNDDVTRRIRRRYSIEKHRLPIGCALKRNVHHASFSRYRASKFDRKRFRPDDDVTGPIRLRHSIEARRLSIGSPLTRNVHLASLPRYGGRKIVPLREIGQSRKTTECPFDPYMTSQTISEVTVRKADRGFLFGRL